MLDSKIIEKMDSAYLYGIDYYSQALASAILQYDRLEIRGFVIQVKPTHFFRLAKERRLSLPETVLRRLVMDEEENVFFEGIPVLFYKDMPDDFLGYICYPEDVERRVYDKYFSERQKRRTVFVDFRRESVLIGGVALKNRLMENGMDLDAPYLTMNGMKILNPWQLDDEEYIEYGSSFFPESYDLLFPALYDDYNNVLEGPYEFDAVQLEEGDVVFDCGANIGTFSCYALFKRCAVWAFEPIPAELDFLKRNMELYGGGVCVPAAVSSESGKCTMNIQEQAGAVASMNWKDENSEEMAVLPWTQESDMELEVDMLTIDEYVEKEGLDRVDFIKADIEGAERYMLMGAKRTLQCFAPKLSICTYHLKDDKEVLEKLILEANPNYVVIHKWRKLFAYVPDKQ